MSNVTSAAGLRRRHLADEASRSLFVLPAVIVLASAVVGEVLSEIDDRLEPGDLPGFLESTQESARTILGAIAGGTITAAAVVLSFTLVAVQLASSQYSPRTLGRFLADRFQQVVMGVVFGTFTYSIVVLRELEDVGPRAELPAPQLAAFGAIIFAIAALLAVLGSIDHTARSLQVESISERVATQSVAIAREEYPLPEVQPPPPEPPPTPPADALVVRAPITGWVQQFVPAAVASCLPPGTTAVLKVAPGAHVTVDDPVLVVWPAPDAKVADALRSVIDLGPTRTMQDDVGFGIQQLVDIAARALSPAVNDPYTAEEVVIRMVPVLTELAVRDLTPRPLVVDDRRVLPAPAWDFDRHLDLAVGSLRWHAREQPWTLAVIVTQLGRLRDEALERRADVDLGPVEHQARVLLEELHRLAPPDAERVREAARAAGWAAPTAG